MFAFSKMISLFVVTQFASIAFASTQYTCIGTSAGAPRRIDFVIDTRLRTAQVLGVIDIFGLKGNSKVERLNVSLTPSLLPLVPSPGGGLLKVSAYGSPTYPSSAPMDYELAIPNELASDPGNSGSGFQTFVRRYSIGGYLEGTFLLGCQRSNH